MYQVKIKAGDEVHELDFPETMGEVRFSQYVDFFIAKQAFDEWIVDPHTNDLSPYEFLAMYIWHMANIIGEFTGNRDLVGILPVGEVSAHLSKLAGVQSVDDIDLDTTSQNLSVIFSNVFKVLAGYKPRHRTEEDCTFEYKGDTWTIPTVYRSTISGQIQFNEVETDRAIQALKTSRLYSLNRKNDATGSVWFTTSIRALAILARSEKYPFPFDSDSKAKVYIDRMTMYWKEAPADLVLDVQNWLNGYMGNLENDPDLHYFYNAPDPDDMDPESLEKVKKANQKRWDRANWDWVRKRIIDSGKFTRPDMTPIHSAAVTPFRDALRLLSMQNAVS